MNENIHYNLKTVKSIYPYSHYQSESIEPYTLEVPYLLLYARSSLSTISISFLFPSC